VPPELLRLFRELDLETLRLRRPSKFIFFCGGAMDENPKARCSLRHYLLRDRAVGPRLKANIVLAEEANQLYRDTDYSDLISFEEDIARIAALVLLIAESAGSLAELGAFAAVDPIRDKLAVLIQSQHESEESFVRYGPLEKLRNEDDRRLAAYPWRTNGQEVLIKATAKPHVASIIRFTNELLKRTPAEELWRTAADLQPFIVILWILHLSQAMPITQLLEYANALYPVTQKELKNRLYCMKLAGWVAKFRYGNVDFWCSTSTQDPISRYSFIPTATVRDTSRRKQQVVAAISSDLHLSRLVREEAATRKGVAA
jgi:hypothetical protein